MSATEAAAIDVSPPAEDDIRVVALTTSPSVEIDLSEFLGGASTDHAGNRRAVWITFEADVAFGITFSKAIGDAITDPDLTATSGSGRCWRRAADQEWNRKIGPANARIKVRGTAAGILRYYPSSKQP